MTPPCPHHRCARRDLPTVAAVVAVVIVAAVVGWSVAEIASAIRW